jgi:hypothetical protein
MIETIELKQFGLKKQTVVRDNTWGSLKAVGKAICEDGTQRFATVTAEPDTFFSIPARVSVKGTTVRGYLTCETLAGYQTVSIAEVDPAVWKFIAYKYLKNWRLVSPDKEDAA